MIHSNILKYRLMHHLKINVFKANALYNGSLNNISLKFDIILSRILTFQLIVQKCLHTPVKKLC